MKYVIGAIAALLVIGGGIYALSGINNTNTSNTDNASEDAETIVAVASFYPLEFVLEQIGGGAVEVINIGEGQDPHDFRPTARDIQTLLGADFVAINGAGLEPWGEDIEAQLANANVPLYVTAENIELMESDHDEHGHDDHDKEEHGDEHDEHDHGAFDPHVWLDPSLLSEIAEQIQEKLSVIDPANADVYELNAGALIGELETLDAEYMTTLGSCALEEVITSHDAFGYIAEAYGFEIHSIAGLSTQDTPSARTLAELRAEAEEGIGAILLEENSIAAFGETLARETGLKTLTINPIAFVSEDEDYFLLMRQNLDVFKEALQCTNE